MLIGYIALALVGVWLNLSTPAKQDTTMATLGSHTRKQDAHRAHALLAVALIDTDSFCSSAQDSTDLLPQPQNAATFFLTCYTRNILNRIAHFPQLN